MSYAPNLLQMYLILGPLRVGKVAVGKVEVVVREEKRSLLLDM